MSQSNDAPREWWIIPDSIMGYDVINPAITGCTLPSIHVIEHAAYAKLKAEYDNYINGKPGEWYIVQLKNERDQLRAKLDVAIEILELLGRVGAPAPLATLAREALEKLKD